MARVLIPTNTIKRGTGLAQPAQTNADATNKNYLVNDAKTFLEIVSSDAGSQTVTFEIPTPTSGTDGQAVSSLVITVAAGATVYVGPFPAIPYTQTDGNLYIDPSVSTTLKFRAYNT